MMHRWASDYFFTGVVMTMLLSSALCLAAGVAS
jgi:hypothetical protein